MQTFRERKKRQFNIFKNAYDNQKFHHPKFEKNQEVVMSIQFLYQILTQRILSLSPNNSKIITLEIVLFGHLRQR